MRIHRLLLLSVLAAGCQGPLAPDDTLRGHLSNADARLDVSGLQFSGGLMRLNPFQLYYLADAYLPLDVPSTLATARVGLVWRPGR